MSEDGAGFALSFQTACTGLLAYRVIKSFILLTCLLLLRQFHLLSLIFWFGSVYLSSNLNMKPDQCVYFAQISFAQAYEQETFDIKGIGGSSEILVGNC